MSSEVENKTSNLKTALESLTKTYVIHDANSRPIAAYEAKTDAKVGEPCMVTRFGYRESDTTNISTQVKFSKEDNAFWDPDDQNWDDNLAALPNPLRDPNIP